MKITVKNITQEYPKIKIDLPEPLSQEKFEKLQSTFLPNYDKSDVIKKMVDTFVEKLNEAIAKAKPQKKKVNSDTKKFAQNAKKSTSKAKKPTKKTATNKPKPKCNINANAIKVESYPEDERLVRRFHAAVGKERQRRTILGIYRDIEKRKAERKVNKNSPHADLINEISARLKRVLDFMSSKSLTHIKIEASEKSQDFFKQVEQVSKAKEIRASVNLLKRFIGIEGAIDPDKEKVQRLDNAFESALKRGKICEGDLYFIEIREAHKAIKVFLSGKSKNITISPTGLKGLEKLAGLGKPKATATKKGSGNKTAAKKRRKCKSQLNGVAPVPGPVPTPSPAPEPEPVIVNRFSVDLSNQETKNELPTDQQKPVSNNQDKNNGEGLNGLFTPIAAQAEQSSHEKITLPGDMGKFLGYVERYEYSILLRGEKGAGKTRMMYQMMNTLAKGGFTVGCFSLEIGKHSNIVTDMRNSYLCPTIVNKVQIAEAAPQGLDDIRAAAKIFDVVAIDSWGKIPGIKADDFDKLRKEFPETMFIVIFQSTTNGTARGGSMPEYDAGIVIQVAEGGRAYCEKNRYNGEDLVYLVFERKLEGYGNAA
ncbi:MAG: hypothetical protein N4A71_05730 [Carboxylicivirga sp.]|jgi:hypothetical protein|nr:hypothetical protein [Carboxylicivirga sp.]